MADTDRHLIKNSNIHNIKTDTFHNFGNSPLKDQTYFSTSNISMRRNIPLSLKDFIIFYHFNLFYLILIISINI